MPETKTELTNEINRLENVLEQQRSQHSFTREELHRVRRLFVDLYEKHHTLNLRYGWLEDAARDVVLACPKHLPELTVKLADELGIEIPQED